MKSRLEKYVGKAMLVSVSVKAPAMMILANTAMNAVMNILSIDERNGDLFLARNNMKNSSMASEMTPAVMNISLMMYLFDLKSAGYIC